MKRHFNDNETSLQLLRFDDLTIVYLVNIRKIRVTIFVTEL